MIKKRTNKFYVITATLVLLIVISGIVNLSKNKDNSSKMEISSDSGILSLTIDTTLKGCSTRPGLYLSNPNAVIDWGDGSAAVRASDGLNRHSFASGEYVVTVTGTFEQFGSGEQTEEIGDCFKSLNKWTPETKAISAAAAFSNASNIVSVVQPPLTVTDYSSMFWNAGEFNGNLSEWDVSKVSDMSGMFHGANSFNQDISKWDTSNVENMEEMFHGAENFNQDIGNWQVSKVKSMTRMFSMESILPSANNFNQDISKWDISSVEKMDGMFRGNRKFNQDIGDWNVSSVKSMIKMFENATSMAGDLSGWHVKNLGANHNNFRKNNSLLVEPNWVKA